MSDVSGSGAPLASAAPQRQPWPEIVFQAGPLRGLDARGRRELEDAGALRTLADGAVVYRAGEGGESFYVVAAGGISLVAVRRGDDGDSELRSVAPAGSFGEESIVPAARRAEARATGPTVVAEIPVHVFRRASARSGSESAERMERTLRRAATRDLLRTVALCRDLPDADIDRLLDVVRYHRLDRGQTIYREGDAPAELWLVGEGMVQLQSDDGERLHVRAYLARGDFFGDGELESGTPRATSAVASGPSLLLAIPAPAFRELVARHLDLLPRLRRVSEGLEVAQRAIVKAAAKNQTQHVFRDLYRLQVARSLLTIDLETCVRCGHCSWACAELHGVARLVRRGDKLVTRVDAAVDPARLAAGPLDGLAAALAADAAIPQTLMLPNSCQHCENPACMVDCPTGAIGRDPEGEVFIRDALCTGCGACAKACPWDNIQMAPRPPGTPAPALPGPLTGARATTSYAELAVKCDLCRDYASGPACVQACPTGSILRVNPSSDFADVRDLLGGARRAADSTARTPPVSWLLGAAIAAMGTGTVGAIMQARGLWSPARGLGYAAGVGAALGTIALLAYAAPKRGVRVWMRWKTKGAGAAGGPAAAAARAEAPRVVSRVARHAQAHLCIGLFTLALVFAHAPWPPAVRASIGGALWLAFVLSSLAGVATATAYRLVPPALTRLERTAALPEDLPAARGALLDRLYREVSGRSDLVKKIFERILLPYGKASHGPLLLLASGRRLREEEQRLRARVDAVLAGRGSERLAGIDELVRIVVELRAIPAQRWLQRALRWGLPLHIVTFALACALLVAHVAQAVLWR
jgi:Fe-S-cluster-containing dehydrogenase component